MSELERLEGPLMKQLGGDRREHLHEGPTTRRSSSSASCRSATGGRPTAPWRGPSWPSCYGRCEEQKEPVRAAVCPRVL